VNTVGDVALDAAHWCGQPRIIHPCYDALHILARTAGHREPLRAAVDLQ